MALIKEIELESGVKAAYHNISVIKDAPARTVLYEVCSYIDKAARESGKAPVLKGGMITLPDGVYKGEAEHDVYKYLKTTETFNGAKDD